MNKESNGRLTSETDDSFNPKVCTEKNIKNHIGSWPVIWQWIVGGGTGLATVLTASISDNINWLGGVLIGQIILSIVGAIASLLSALDMMAKSREAGIQADALEELQGRFIGAISLNCPDGREDSNVRECYCFNEDGSRRTDRNNAEGCQELYNSLDQKYELESMDLIVRPINCKIKLCND